jgi:hypothetical protein
MYKSCIAKRGPTERQVATSALVVGTNEGSDLLIIPQYHLLRFWNCQLLYEATLVISAKLHVSLF